ncbi:hypothetical protein Desor_2542 [Desulfosporosinus orientis DSM 765]|uniref:Uncharacterized protein n=1 Tax=Desulfosporosinus orientis (strain ATCC 19365 / DSM 765 / NCIMB 8382 / VKM B-1628 / Singapore I) TaxID=768706 RepID=G7WGL9_DESOD|nr:hypothetical protein [Desulfosporosinus orientis]AET68096.1 hypothetical protein Desor_2542 [Desulfosporosinus orientis DSM 765]
MKIIVGVKYCGHCNPLIEGPEIVKKIKLLQPDKLEFVSWHEAEKDILLIVSGCAADCAERPPFNGPVISVAGSSVERIQYALTELPGQILKKIKDPLW